MNVEIKIPNGWRRLRRANVAQPGDRYLPVWVSLREVVMTPAPKWCEVKAPCDLTSLTDFVIRKIKRKKRK